MEIVIVDNSIARSIEIRLFSVYLRILVVYTDSDSVRFLTRFISHKMSSIFIFSME